MEKSYFFILLFFVCALSFSQTKCEDADSDLLYAYSHVKSAYKSNNISHLKYYSNRSLEAFERSKKKLKDCGCESAYDLAYDGAKLLAHVESADTYEDGRFYVKRARDIAQQSIVELDKFTVLTEEEESLLSLKSEKEKLEQLQKELKEKEAEIKAKLAEQKQKESEQNKALLIKTYKEAIANNIEAYNKILELCNCEAETLADIKPSDSKTDNKGVEEIKLYLLENIKGLTNNYLSRMDIFDED